MNFAAQLFYWSYLRERLERLYSPRPALKDSEENDPFWQRWEITTRRPPPPRYPPDPSSSQLRSIVTDLPSAWRSETASVPLSSGASVLPPQFAIHPQISDLFLCHLLLTRGNQDDCELVFQICVQLPRLPQSRRCTVPMDDLSHQMGSCKPSPSPSRSMSLPSFLLLSSSSF